MWNNAHKKENNKGKIRSYSLHHESWTRDRSGQQKQDTSRITAVANRSMCTIADY